MTPRLVVRSAAEADIAAAALWYEERATGLGTEFLRAVDVILAEIRRMPERFPVIHPQCRRALLRRFPYAVYFVPSADLISVVASCTRAAIRAGGRSASMNDRRQAHQPDAPGVRCRTKALSAAATEGCTS